MLHFKKLLHTITLLFVSLIVYFLCKDVLWLYKKICKYIYVRVYTIYKR